MASRWRVHGSERRVVCVNIRCVGFVGRSTDRLASPVALTDDCAQQVGPAPLSVYSPFYSHICDHNLDMFRDTQTRKLWKNTWQMKICLTADGWHFVGMNRKHEWSVENWNSYGLLIQCCCCMSVHVVWCCAPTNGRHGWTVAGVSPTRPQYMDLRQLV